MRKIAFIGVGNMAGAIIGGMLNSGTVDHAHLILSDRFPEKCAAYVNGTCRRFDNKEMYYEEENGSEQ